MTGTDDPPPRSVDPDSGRPDDPPATAVPVRDAVADADALAFVHAGRAGDADLRYLLRTPLPDEPCAYLHPRDGDPVVYAVPPATARLEDATDCRVEPATAPDAAVGSWLADCGDAPVLAPRHLPHDVAVRIEAAGNDLTSTAAVATARARKTGPERDRLERVAREARAGVVRAREVLAAARVDDAGAYLESEPLSRERLRRRVAAALAAAGLAPAATRVEAPADPLRPGHPVVVTVAPRGHGGYRTRLSRTLAVEGSGGPARRAHVAVEAARRAAVDAAAPGASVDRVREELIAELGAFGLDPVADARLVHGVGLAPHEAPRPGEGTTLAPGHVVAIAPATPVPGGVGTVRLADLLVVTEEGTRVPTDVATGMAVRS